MKQHLTRPLLRTGLLAAVVSVALLPTMVGAVVPVGYAPPPLVPVDINIGPGDQFDPHVSGDWVAYTDDVTIRYYNFATNVDAQIPLGSGVHDLLSSVSGSKIVFSRVTAGVKTAVMVFDAATPAIPPVEIDPAPATTRLGAAIGGDTVAYIDFGLQANGELVVHDLATSTSTRLTTDTATDGNPSVSPDGAVVVWEHCATSLTNCDIWQATKVGGVWTVDVTAGSTNPEGNPHTNGSIVAFDRNSAGQAQIIWRSVSGGAETPIEMPGYAQNPTVAGDFIAFESRASILESADIFVYDTVNNRLFQITNTPLVNEQLNGITVLPDGRVRVVWCSDEDGSDQRNVKGATFTLPNVAPTLTASTESGYGIDGVSPDLGPASTAFTYKIVYADFENQIPTAIHVCIDGSCHGMMVDNGATLPLQDGNYKNGEQYSFTTTLPLGPHNYYFEASDGTDSARFPGTGVLNGPLVTDLVIATTSLPGATISLPYTTTISATGGTPPYHWDTGALPPGLVMDFSTGVISGTPTATGTYVFTIFVADAAGGFASKTFTIVVNPMPTPPVLHVPGTITVNATGRGGAVVTFVVTATDATDPHPTVACVPPSGSSFPIGTTTVVCRATNASGLGSRATLNVVVKGAAAQVVDLIALVARLKLQGNFDINLEARLVNILAALVLGGNPAIVCSQLNAFLTDVRAQVGRALTAAQAATLVASATQIKAVLGCP